MLLDQFHTTNQDLAKFQASVERALAGLQGKQLPRGLLLSNINLDSSQDNAVQHKLNRRYLGYIIVDKNANAQIWTSVTLNNFKEKQVVLNTSSNVVVSLWIF